MNEMLTRAEFLEYMKAFEGRLNHRFALIDGQFEAVDGRFEGVDSRLDRVESRLDSVDSRFDRVDSRLDQLDSRITSLDTSMHIQFEETRGLIRLSLEAVEGLRETSERGFSDVRTELDEQTGLLKMAVKYIGGRDSDSVRRD